MFVFVTRDCELMLPEQWLFLTTTSRLYDSFLDYFREQHHAINTAEIFAHVLRRVVILSNAFTALGANSRADVLQLFNAAFEMDQNHPFHSLRMPLSGEIKVPNSNVTHQIVEFVDFGGMNNADFDERVTKGRVVNEEPNTPRSAIAIKHAGQILGRINEILNENEQVMQATTQIVEANRRSSFRGDALAFSLGLPSGAIAYAALAFAEATAVAGPAAGFGAVVGLSAFALKRRLTRSNV